LAITGNTINIPICPGTVCPKHTGTANLSLAVSSANAQTPCIVEALELTDEQRDQVQDIVQDLKTDVNDILTDEQQQQFRAAFRELQDIREAAAEIDNLTDDQKTKIRAALQDSRAELQGVLTEEQIAELRSTIRERRQSRR
jgi:Spy/CpxP family protein refolding chaperone